MVYESASQIDFEPEDCASLPLPGRVLLASPEHFAVEYVINPHMADNVGSVDRAEAGREWRMLQDAYESMGFTVNVVEGVEGLADMVFCANQTLPYFRPTSGERGVVISRMHAEQRAPEVEHFERFFRNIGYEITHLDERQVSAFEGMGDAIWHPRRYLIWGGYGIRSSRAAYDHISEELDVPVIALRLEDPDFYHLDTCFSALDPETVLIYPGAFDAEGLAMIRRMFDRVIEAPEDEARGLFACNAHSPDGEHVIIHKGCERTKALLREAGFDPVELDTSEFLKAGGSVFCMKQMFW